MESRNQGQSTTVGVRDSILPSDKSSVNHLPAIRSNLLNGPTSHNGTKYVKMKLQMSKFMNVGGRTQVCILKGNKPISKGNLFFLLCITEQNFQYKSKALASKYR